MKYYEASTEYGVKRVKEACFKWLLVNLLSFLPETPKRLREIRLFENFIKMFQNVLFNTSISFSALI